MTGETHSKRRWWNLGNISSRVLESFSTRLKTFSKLSWSIFSYVCLCLLTDWATSQIANLSVKLIKKNNNTAGFSRRAAKLTQLTSFHSDVCVCGRFLFIGRWCRYRSDRSVYHWRTAGWRMWHDAVVALTVSRRCWGVCRNKCPGIILIFWSLFYVLWLNEYQCF